MFLFILGFILFCVALGFLSAELFVGAHGILAIISGCFALGGIIAMYIANPTAGLVSATLVLLAAPFAFFYFLKIYPHTPVGRRVIIGRPKPTPPDAQQTFAETLTGREGIAMTPLRPAGAVEIDGRRVDCVAEAEIIEAGSKVRVQRVSGMKVIVVKV